MVQERVGKRLPLIPVFLAVLVLVACHRSTAPGGAPVAASPRAAPSPVAAGLPAAAGSAGAVGSTPAAGAPAAGAPAAAGSPAPGAPGPAPSRSAAPRPAPPAGAAQPAPAGAKPTIVLASPSPGSSPTRPLANAGSLLATGRGQAGILPEDFKIGPLASGRSDSPDKDAAYTVATAFLTRLVAGTVDRQAIAPESQESLTDTLTYGLKQGHAPSSFRVGEPKQETDGELAANVRLFTSDSSSEGEIYLAGASDHWLVTDVQINLADLAAPSTAPKEKFFPSPYRWLLED
jgi:hypothetical protein